MEKSKAYKHIYLYRLGKKRLIYIKHTIEGNVEQYICILYLWCLKHFPKKKITLFFQTSIYCKMSFYLWSKTQNVICRIHTITHNPTSHNYQKSFIYMHNNRIIQCIVLYYISLVFLVFSLYFTLRYTFNRSRTPHFYLWTEHI